MANATIGTAWLAVEMELERIGDGPANSDDCGMMSASAPDLAAWADDLEARVGLDVDTFRERLADYVRVRNQAAILREFPEMTDALALPSFFPMRCDAWHNDAAVAYRYCTPSRVVELWADVPERDKRELDGDRYTLIVYASDDGETTGETLAEFSAERWQDIADDVGAFAVELANEPNPEVVRACAAFVAALKAELGSDKFDKMRRDNANRDHPNVCHSHDYCDANMVMLHAVPDEDMHNEAWQLGRRALTGAK